MRQRGPARKVPGLLFVPFLITVKTILVLSLNPAIDVEWCVDRVLWEEKNLIRSERRWAGGKGVNVARWLRFLGGRPQLLVPLGGASGAELKRQIRA